MWFFMVLLQPKRKSTTSWVPRAEEVEEEEEVGKEQVKEDGVSVVEGNLTYFSFWSSGEIHGSSSHVDFKEGGWGGYYTQFN